MSNQERTDDEESRVNIVGPAYVGHVGAIQPEVMPHKPSSATTGAPASGCERDELFMRLLQ